MCPVGVLAVTSGEAGGRPGQAGGRPGRARPGRARPGQAEEGEQQQGKGGHGAGWRPLLVSLVFDGFCRYFISFQY